MASLSLWIWFALTCLVGLVWLRRHYDLNRGRREPVLEPADARGEGLTSPHITVLIAAKDEEQNIARCLDGLLAQAYPRFDVIVIDDRSRDRTGQIIDRFAARDPRVQAVHVTELAPGWFGKNNAMREGVARAGGDWLCFSDADCCYESPELLAAAVSFALRERIEFLSVLPHLEAHGFWERVVQPVAGAILVFWFPPQQVNHPGSECAYANGAFMLLSRRAYEEIGGHEPVKATLNEDMHMARRAKRAGVALRVIRGGGMVRVRMYVGLRAIWRGWSRIFYGCFGTLSRLLTSVLLLSVFSLSPYVSLATAPLTGGQWGWIAAAAGFAILAQQTVVWRFYPIAGRSAAWALTYPLGALLCLAMTVQALTKLAGSTTNWRGTAYRGGGTA